MALAISYAVLAFGICMTITCAMKHDKKRTRNQLTMKPYYLLLMYLAGQIIGNSIFISNSTRGQTEKYINYFYQVSALLIQMFGSLAIAVQSFEWMAYTQLVTFQARYPVNQLEIKRADYRRQELKLLVGVTIVFAVEYFVTLLVGLIQCELQQSQCWKRGRTLEAVNICFQLLLASCVFFVMRHQLMQKQRGPYAEHYKLMWVQYLSILNLCAFIVLECALENKLTQKAGEMHAITFVA